VIAAARRYSGTFKGAGRHDHPACSTLDRLERAQQTLSSYDHSSKASEKPLGIQGCKRTTPASATRLWLPTKHVVPANQVACGATSAAWQQPARDEQALKPRRSHSFEP